MKEISEKLAFELLEMIRDAEMRSDEAYMAARYGDAKTAENKSLIASVRLFEAKTHLEWHMSGYLNSEQQAAPCQHHHEQQHKSACITKNTW